MSWEEDFGDFLEGKHLSGWMAERFRFWLSQKATDGEKRESELLSVLEDVLGMVEEGPCCGSGDERTSHYHCWQCGKVGGMYVCNAISGKPNCKPDPENEYVKRKAVLRKAEEFVESRDAGESQKA